MKLPENVALDSMELWDGEFFEYALSLYLRTVKWQQRTESRSKFAFQG